MNRADTTNILRLRRELTRESFNDGTVDAWTDALRSWTPTQVRAAINASALEGTQHITVPHVVAHLPTQQRPTTPTRDITPDPHCQTCDGTGIDRLDDNGPGYACRCWWDGGSVAS